MKKFNDVVQDYFQDVNKAMASQELQALLHLLGIKNVGIKAKFYADQKTKRNELARLYASISETWTYKK